MFNINEVAAIAFISVFTGALIVLIGTGIASALDTASNARMIKAQTGLIEALNGELKAKNNYIYTLEQLVREQIVSKVRD